MPRDRLRLTTGEADLATYTFNRHVIRHRSCPTCGLHLFGEGVDPRGKLIAALILRCLEDFNLASVTVTEFDGRAL